MSLINQQTKSQLRELALSPPHALLLSSKATSDGLEAALYFAECAGIEKSHHHLIATDSNTSIGIEQARQLQHLYKLSNKDDAKRLVLIESAERMTIEAQNALLKLIEEPPKNVIFALTTAASGKILKTIRSRALEMPIKPPSLDQLKSFIAESEIETGLTNTLLAASDGSSLELAKLIEDEKYRSQRLEGLAQAKEVVQAKDFTRFTILSVANKKDSALQLLRDVALVLEMAIAGSLEDKQQLKKLASNLRATLATQDAIGANGQVKLQLSALIADWR